MPTRRQLVRHLLPLLASFAFVLASAYRVQGQTTNPERAASIQAAKDRLRLIEESLRTLGNDGSAPSVETPPAPAPAAPPASPPPETGAKPPNAVETGWERLRRIEQGLREVKQGIGSLRSPRSGLPPSPPFPPPPPVLSSTPVVPSAPPPALSTPSRDRGNYFLFLTPALAFGTKQDYLLPAGGNAAELKSGSGLAANLAFGRRFDAWKLGVEFGYRRLPYDTFTLPAAGSYVASGDSTSYSLSLHGGRDFPVSPNLNLRTGVSLGVADRREHFTLPGLGTPFTADGSRFHGSLQTSLEYFFGPRCSILFGYRFTYLHSFDSFDSLPLHQAELGLNWDL